MNKFRLVLFAFIVGIFLVIATPSLATHDTTHFYISEWRWNDSNKLDSFWQANITDDSVGLIDLRTIVQMSQSGGANQCCLLIGYSSEKTSTPTLIYLGNSIDGPILNISDVESLLQQGRFTRTSVSGIVRELFGAKSDPTGQTAVKPLIPNSRKVITANIGNVRLFTDRLATSSIDWHKAMSVLQNDYDRVKFSEPEQALRMAGYWKLKYGFDIRTEIQKLDGIRDPKTVVMDGFNRPDEQVDANANWTTIDGDAASFDIVSNVVERTDDSGTLTAVRYDGSALSSDDMYTEVELVEFSGSILVAGIGTRINDGGDGGDYYFGRLFHHFSQADTWRIHKVINGTSSHISTELEESTTGVPFTLKLESDGSNHELFKGAVSKVSVTDSSITGNNYGGLVGLDTFTGRVAGYDDFEAADLAVAPDRRVFIFYP